MKPLIQLKDVQVTYDKGKSNEMIALHSVNLEIYDGEYIVFLGPSGCGKSTLLYTIAGLEIPSSGDVLVDGKNINQTSPLEKIEFYRTTIGMIFQAFYLVAHLNAADNVMLSGMFAGRSPEERRKKATVLMDRFGITSYKDRKPSSMSGGQQQRTAIARALMNDPHIILADEPVGNLDSKNAETVLELLADIHREEKKTVIQVTHNAADARYADRVFYMKDGHVEKVVTNANPYRGKGTKETPTPTLSGELAKLAADHPSLDNTQLRALLIMRNVFMPYTLDTEHKIIAAIERYIKKEIDVVELTNELDARHGGAGLYAPKAIHSAKEIERLFKEMEALTEKDVASTDLAALRLRAASVAEYLLQSYGGKMSPEEKRVIIGLIEKRFEGKLDAGALRKALSQPIAAGGAGLHGRTGERFGEEVETLISK